MNPITKADQWRQRRLQDKQNKAGIRPSAADQANIPFVDYRAMPLKPGVRRQPRWLRGQSFCAIGCWEGAAWRRYSGIATTWAADDYAFEHSQEYLDDVKGLGCNAVIVPYDYGHGEKFNEEEIRLSKAFIRLAHKNGLKAGTYFRSDIVWIETLDRKELAELKHGFQVDNRGHPIQYLFGSAVRTLCYHDRGALARLKRHVVRAIADLKTDILHLDGFIVGGYEGSTGACRCPLCTADFHKFLEARYGKDRKLAQERFGHPFVSRVVPPAYYPLDTAPYDSGPISPNWVEWVAFRCHWTSRILSHVALWARQLNPEVMIEINNTLPCVRENGALCCGMDMIGAGYYADAHWSEDGYPPRLHDNGLLIQRVRQFKRCRTANAFTLTYMHEEDKRALRQNLAHTAAFNRGHIGCIGFPPHMNFSNSYNVHYGVKAEFMGWLRARWPYFRDTESAAQIAVWHPRENMAVSGKMAYAAALRLEQLLIETCRGFDIIFEESPEKLARYDLLLVPNVECMSLSQIEQCLDFARRGGSLLVGQDSACFDLWHRRRIENAWAELFGGASAATTDGAAVADGVAGIIRTGDRRAQADRLVCAPYGKGKAVYVPRLVDPARQPSLVTVHGELDGAIDHTNWVVPERAGELDRALDWLMEGRARFAVSAKRGMLAEFLRQEREQRWLVHLVNLGAKPQRGCRLTLCLPEPIRDVTVLAPPTDQPPKWRVRQKGRRWNIDIEFIDVYAIVAIECGTT